MNKTVKGLKTEIEAFVEMKYLDMRAGMTEASFTNRIQVIEYWISCIGDKIGDRNIRVNENIKSKNIPGIKHPGNLELLWKDIT